MKYATLKDNRTRKWANFVAGNVALATDDLDDFSGSATAAALIAPNDLYENWLREYHFLRAFESRHQRPYGNLIETVPTLKNTESDSLESINAEIRTLLLSLKLSMLERSRGDAVDLRSGPAQIARELLTEIVTKIEETPILYTSPDGGLVIDFLDHNKRLTLVIDDGFCVFTLTKGGETSQKTVDLPDSGFHAEAKLFLKAFSE